MVVTMPGSSAIKALGHKGDNRLGSDELVSGEVSGGIAEHQQRLGRVSRRGSIR
jgi:hypothetical protein